VEFGRVVQRSIGARRPGSASWKLTSLEELAALKLRPEHRTSSDWPEDDDDRIQQWMVEQIYPRFRRGGKALEATWQELGWTCATDAFVTRQWARFGDELIRIVLGQGESWWMRNLAIPTVTRGVLKMGFQGAFDRVIPPTEAGWAEFLRLAP